MMLLTKEAAKKDRSLTTQPLISSKNSEEKLNSERVWRSERYFSDTRAKLNPEKKIPENALLHVNQLYISTVKNGDITMYCYNFIIGQLIVATNQPVDIENYACQQNDVKLHTVFMI